MANFKAVCSIDKGEGMESHTLYVRDQENEQDAERAAKYYCIQDKNWVFYGAEVEPV